MLRLYNEPDIGIERKSGGISPTQESGDEAESPAEGTPETPGSRQEKSLPAWLALRALSRGLFEPN